MKKYAIHSAFGEILQTLICSPGASLIQQLGESYIVEVSDGVDDATHFIVSDSARPKQPMPLITTNTPLIADGIDEVIISGIPSGVQVEWPDGFTHIEDSGSVGFKVDLPGTYAFQFTAIPYLDKEVTIEAVAAT